MSLRAVSGAGDFLGAYTWAGLPAAASFAGYRARVTDYGVNLMVISDGTRWMPNGPQVLARSGVAASVTGTTAATTLATVAVPPGIMGVNGGLTYAATWSMTNNANGKSLQTTFGGTLITNIGGVSSIATYSDWRRIRNRNATGSQIFSTDIGSAPTSTATGGTRTASIDTTAAQNLLFVGTLTNTADTLTLENYDVVVMP